VRLRVVAVGRDRSGLYAPAIEEYAKRLGRYVKFELVEVPEARKHAGTAQAKEEEAEALLAKLAPRERVVALDERGAEWTSVAFAERVRRWTEGGRDVALVIGGSDGLSRVVLDRAEETLAPRG
jgi:23S rRNA (pseudouridine1915-N3)-methyltransferase